ncbi:MAG: PAS domain S-box protein, partial [Cytophagales bacterium]|nr:PAS domain S-box protein [Cytophagales bacterium]
MGGLFQASQLGLLMMEKETFQIEMTNEPFCKELGLKPEQLYKRKFTDIIFAGFEEVFAEVLKEVASGKKLSSTELALRHANGQIVYFDCFFEWSNFENTDYLGGVFNNITEKKLKEIAHAESQTQLSALYGLLDDVIVVVDIHGTYVKIAPTATNFFFKDPKKLEGKRLNELFPEENAVEIARKVRYAIESGNSVYFEYQLPISDVMYWFNMSIRPIPGQKALVVARDITENKRIEFQLAKNNEFNQSVLSKIPNSVYIYDFDEERLVYINDSHFQLTGYDKELILNKDADSLIPQLVHPEDMPIIGAALAQLKTFNDEQVLEFVYRSKHAKGHWIWVRDSARVFQRNFKGEVKQIITCSIDITASQVIKEELLENKSLLKENNRMFETLLQNLPGMVCRLENNFEWTTKFISEGCEGITGYSAQDFMSNKISIGRITHPIDNEAVYDAVQAALEKRVAYRVSYRIQTKSGQERWLWEQGKGIFDQNGQLEIIEAYISDITDTKLAEKRLQKSEERFRSIAEALTIPVMISRLSDGKILYGNEYLSKLVDVPKEDLIFYHSTDFYFDVHEREKIVNEFRTSGQIREYELKGKNIHGEPF